MAEQDLVNPREAVEWWSFVLGVQHPSSQRDGYCRYSSGAFLVTEESHSCTALASASTGRQSERECVSSRCDTAVDAADDDVLPSAECRRCTRHSASLTAAETSSAADWASRHRQLRVADHLVMAVGYGINQPAMNVCELNCKKRLIIRF